MNNNDYDDVSFIMILLFVCLSVYFLDSRKA